MVVLANAFTEFHFSMVFDTLHFVEETGRRCEYLDSNFDFFGGKLRYTIEVCKMITYCTVKQRSLARTRLIQLLKSIRSKGNDKVTPIQLQLDEDDVGDADDTVEGIKEYSLKLNENFNFDSDCSDISCYMTLILLRNLQEYDISIHLGKKVCSLSTDRPARMVFAESEVLWCRTLQRIMQYSQSQIEKRSKLSPISLEILMIECNLSNVCCFVCSVIIIIQVLC